MSEEVKEAQENINIPVPKGETEFSRDEGHKNFTKLVIDDEHNKAFVEEMKEAVLEGYEKNHTEVIMDDENNKGFLEEIQEVTKESHNLDENNTEKPMVTSGYCAVEGTVIPEATVTSSNGTTTVIPASVVGKGPDDSVATTISSDEFERPDEEEEIAKVIDSYIENPESLKFKDDEIKELLSTGIADKETMNFIIMDFQNGVDDIIRRKALPETDPDYLSDEKFKSEIHNLVASRISTEKVIKACKELRDPEFIKELFNAKFPWYKFKGSGYILEQFLDYLKRRRMTDTEESRLLFEINNPKNVDRILKNIDSKILKTVKLTNGSKFDLASIFVYIFRWNISNISKVLNRPEEEIENNIKNIDVSGIVGLTSLLFLRFIYSKILRNIERSKLDQYMFVRFFIDNVGVDSLPENEKKLIQESWESIIIQAFELFEKSKAYEDKKKH